MGWVDFIVWPLGAGAFIALLNLTAFGVARLMERPPKVVAGTVTLSREGFDRGQAVAYAPVALLIVVGAARVACREPLADGSWVPLALCLAAFCPMVCWMVLTGFRSGVVISDDGVTYRPAWGALRRVAWEEITEVYYSKCRDCWVIRGGKRPLRLSASFDGLELLWEALEQRCGPGDQGGP
jgi:hypothetical protein